MRLFAQYRAILQQNVVFYSILLFLWLFCSIHVMKPPLLYDRFQRFRPFGLGTKQKTVVSIWVVAILLSISCYMVIVYLSRHMA